MSDQHKQKLSELNSKLNNEGQVTIVGLPITGSARRYFRITDKKNSVIGVFNDDIIENEAFFSFTKHFSDVQIRVPQIISISEDKRYYLLEDLGLDTLAAYFAKQDKNSDASEKLNVLKKVLQELISIQLKVDAKLDYSKCYPRSEFDAQSAQWDLNYFKYSFLKAVDVLFDEQKLEDDFTALVSLVTNVEPRGFMYRDFQLRNIMWKEGQPWFIDYQGGRKGPLYYDLASLLFSPTTALSVSDRKELEQFYFEELKSKAPMNEENIQHDYYCVALVRVLQALGAYGYRGLLQNKAGFAKSISPGIQNFAAILNELDSSLFPELRKVCRSLQESTWAEDYILPSDKLTIKIVSFSFKRGIPKDPSENGGGYVFDCRGIPNPGRYKPYKKQSGLDADVISFLEEHAEVHDFAEKIKAVSKVSIDNYLERNFNHLCYFFGCTGGQHRSVYNAERMLKWLTEEYGDEIIVHIEHREREHWNP